MMVKNNKAKPTETVPGKILIRQDPTNPQQS